MSAAEGITRQFAGVIPGMSVGQDAVAKSYVDAELALRDEDIENVSGSAAAAQNAINTHESSSTAHSASNITYSGSVSATTVKNAIDTQDQRITNIVASAGTSNTEIVDARQPATGSAFLVLRDRLNSVDTQLADNAVSPEKFSGNALQKLQQALDYAITNNASVKISKMYDITGLGTLVINKPQNHSPNTNRLPLYILGVGGGIKKNDSGYMFTSLLEDVGEIYLDRLRFESVEGAGVKIYNGNKLINIFSSYCYYRNCDTIAEANTRYCQGWNFHKDVIVGGHGWAFEADNFWALNIKDCIIEWRENGIRNSNGIMQTNHGINIVGNTIEGLSGRAINLSVTKALKISGNYMEWNLGGYIEILTACAGAEISNNIFILTETQLANGEPTIRLADGVYKSIANETNGILYYMVNNTVLYSEADVALELAIGNLKYFYPTRYDGNAVTYNATTGVTKKYGFMISLTNEKTVSCTAGEVKQVNIRLSEQVRSDDLISVTLSIDGIVTDAENPSILSFHISPSNEEFIDVFFKNNFTATANIRVVVTVVKVGRFSYYG